MSGSRSDTKQSDQALIEATRAGDQRAFAELWRRHHRSGVRVARQFTSSLDADDLVSEAYTRIYQRVLAGGGPTGAFRPYLYTCIRNLASTWGSAARDVQVDNLDDFEDPLTLDDPVAQALDRTLTARAFRSLPERWQSVLWYTEVEGMDPHEVAPLLGMTANGVAALAYRAREGLRKAWLQAHITDAAASGECQWALSRLGDHARHGLGQRDTERMAFHLATCSSCAIVSEEVDEVGSRLALVLIPILLGGIAGGNYLASFGTAAVVTTTAAGVVTSATTPAVVTGAIAVLVALSGTAIVLNPPVVTDEASSVSQSTSARDDVSASAGESLTTPLDETAAADSPVSIPEADAGTAIGDVTDLVDSVVDTISGGTPPPGHTAPGGIVGSDISLGLWGSATPGAHLSLQAAGQVYATTTVDASGNFTLNVTGIPAGTSGLALVQTVDRGYLESLLPTGGLLGGILGDVDALITALIRPIHLGGGGSGVTIDLIS